MYNLHNKYEHSVFAFSDFWCWFLQDFIVYSQMPYGYTSPVCLARFRRRLSLACFVCTCDAFTGLYRRYYRYSHNKPHAEELQAKYGGFNDLHGGLSVCNLFLFGDAQTPTMQGRLYNGVPCLEPFACTTCRRYKRNCSQYSKNCHNNGVYSRFSRIANNNNIND